CRAHPAGCWRMVISSAAHHYTTRNPHPNSPTHAYLAYSALIQLYARSGQLSTADLLYSRGLLPSPRCHMGCDAIEDAHHIFVNCARYEDWRAKAAEELEKRT
ncbi:hypothetical protein B0H14DRAFT_2231219, partial [Mycena olivaceomarginata]